jgi:hypothetical protein
MMNAEEMQMFYASPIEPERQKRLSEYLKLVKDLQDESVSHETPAQFQTTKRALEEINAAMQAEYYGIKREQLRAAQRVEEIRKQLEHTIA